MPPKEVVCSICGETVLKSRTVCVDVKKGERACITHEGIDEIAANAQELNRLETYVEMNDPHRKLANAAKTISKRMQERNR